MTTSPAVLAFAQARHLLAAQAAAAAQATVSLDLELSQATVALDDRGVGLPDGTLLAWSAVAAVAADETACYALHASGPQPIRAYSPQFARFYSLLPTGGAPTVVIGGFPMHRIKGTDPHADTLQKVRTLAPLRGAVLDTTTGLGYTAIAAARTASHVTTIELDPTTLELARLNPWSRALFASPHIEQRIGSAAEIVPTLPDGQFARIVHDPPTLKLAGELYSGAFYRELWRVLRPNGRLFHYIGRLDSASGQGVLRGVVRRLKDVGFARVLRRPQAFGVLATKA